MNFPSVFGKFGLTTSFFNHCLIYLLENKIAFILDELRHFVWILSDDFCLLS